MKIQQQNSFNPSMKAVYFTEGQPLFNKAAKYVNKLGKEVKVTPNGTQYFEDKSVKLTPILKEKFENIPFIKKLSEKNEVFIQYFGEKTEHFGKDFFSYTTIRIPNYDKHIVMKYEAFETDKEHPLKAQGKMLNSVEKKNWFRVTKFQDGEVKELVGSLDEHWNNLEKAIDDHFKQIAEKYPFWGGIMGIGLSIAKCCEKVAEWGMKLGDKLKSKKG